MRKKGGRQSTSKPGLIQVCVSHFPCLLPSWSSSSHRMNPVVIPSSTLKTRVGRPFALTEETRNRFFPRLRKEEGWSYFVTCKGNIPSRTEVICLRSKEHASRLIVNEMEWYCCFCGIFPCLWRTRQRHLSKCEHISSHIDTYPLPDDDALYTELMHDFSSLDIDLDLEKILSGGDLDLTPL